MRHHHSLADSVRRLCDVNAGGGFSNLGPPPLGSAPTPCPLTTEPSRWDNCSVSTNRWVTTREALLEFGLTPDNVDRIIRAQQEVEERLAEGTLLRSLDPVTVVPDRYGDSYSRRGPWLAFPCQPWHVPKEPFDDDVTAMDWWEGLEAPVGGGISPTDAYSDLVARLIVTRPHDVYGPNPGQGGYMWRWQLRWPNGSETCVESMFEPTSWDDRRQGQPAP